jgi:pimeloyl-ACP methyl ester carboxylesterase
VASLRRREARIVTCMTITTHTLDEDITHHDAAVNGVELHYARCGSGPLVVLLHGFPQCWFQYHHQLLDLSRDHTVVAPDLRGCNLSSKPHDVHDYRTCEMVEDVRQLVDSLGFDRFILVGHDVGGAVAWSFALHHPDRLHGLVILDAPHPALFDRALRTDPDQQHASAYMLVARKPDAAERFAADDFAALRAVFDEPFISVQAREAYAQSWRRPGALAGALRWFHAEGLGPESRNGTPANGNVVHDISPLIVSVPTMVVYSRQDAWVRPASHRGLERFVPDLEFVELDAGSHWITDEHPALVNELIRRFSRAHRS